ncbi:MAG: 3-hydroxyacyl-CoA dehydrogenase [Candidatus Abyssobacteria bacterium SURF_17]|uniref:3-hydroxyacyl-CoA dehydrogenase n=1 Tax=Candidatus Abyssobacteria bacterium SURF_17 TaxID=2093361 RepID=A0A419F928_9BACT|nr:MAG: 3-hydroxyacyl-CoA dehydrogenase [Candidatus Abyssubacteria bacterium SURF_17]
MEIRGNTALVTGGASGLGEAAARMIAASGGNVVIMDIKDEQGAVLAKELGAAAIFRKTDVTSEDDVRNAIEAATKQFGGIHFCINCAGTGLAMRTVSKTGPHDLGPFEWLIKLNLIATFNVASKAAFAMSANAPNEYGERGVIINVASIAAFDGQIGQAAYSASKGGVVGMTLPMARDLSRLGIRVVTIAPGLFDTPLLAMLPEEGRQALSASVPFPNRLGTPQEFAMLVEHVLKNQYLNGETIRLDGALRMAPK